MTKRQLIDEIVAINRSAEPAFLAQFQDEELTEYLEHLAILQQPRPHVAPHSCDRYFELESIPSPRDAAETFEPDTAIPDAPTDDEYDTSGKHHIPSFYLDAPPAGPAGEDYPDVETETEPKRQPVSVAASTPDKET